MRFHLHVISRTVKLMETESCRDWMGGGRVGSEEFHFGVMKHSVEGCQWWLNNMNVHEASDYMLSDG